MKRWNLVTADKVVNTPWLNLERNSYKTEDGKVITDYYIVRRSPFVLIIAQYQDQILLVKQYRPATDKVYISVPAGYIEAGEEIIEAARRELLEETGVVGSNFRVLGNLDPLPGYISSRASIVVCECTTPPDLERSDGEVFSVEIYSWTRVVNMIMSGSINEMQTVSALLFAKEWLNT